jgi:alpha-beta hydrolase superfamily lysophospholipase
MESHPTHLTTHDGLRLHLRHWPAGVAARGMVVLVHGLGEHSGRYEHVAAFLTAAGWHVMSFDHRGHGRSEGVRGQLGQPDDMLRDLSLVIDAARRRHLAGPLILLGHSMGGLVAARFVAEGTMPNPAAWTRPVDGLALSSPALAASLNGFQKLLLAVLGKLAPNLAVANGLLPEWVSRDPKVVAAYRADSLVHNRVSPKLASFILQGGEFVRAQARRWTTPTLLLFAGRDRCVAPEGSREFARDVPVSVLTVREFPELFHEIFNEPEQAEVLSSLGQWLAQQRA